MFIPDEHESIVLEALTTRVLDLDRLAGSTISGYKFKRYKDDASTLRDMISTIEDGGFVEDLNDQD